MKVGSLGVDVQLLQKILNQNNFTVAKKGAGSPLKETKKYGGATREAIKRFQIKYKITPVNGLFGPKTRAKVNSLLEKGIFTIVK
jgi:peptidoglycan hydrolase-like protein with peptidoglycan-binding domain